MRRVVKLILAFGCLLIGANFVWVWGFGDPTLEGTSIEAGFNYWYGAGLGVGLQHSLANNIALYGGMGISYWRGPSFFIMANGFYKMKEKISELPLYIYLGGGINFASISEYTWVGLMRYFSEINIYGAGILGIKLEDVTKEKFIKGLSINAGIGIGISQKIEREIFWVTPLVFPVIELGYKIPDTKIKISIRTSLWQEAVLVKFLL